MFWNKNRARLNNNELFSKWNTDIFVRLSKSTTQYAINQNRNGDRAKEHVHGSCIALATSGQFIIVTNIYISYKWAESINSMTKISSFYRHLNKNKLSKITKKILVLIYSKYLWIWIKNIVWNNKLPPFHLFNRNC